MDTLRYQTRLLCRFQANCGKSLLTLLCHSGKTKINVGWVERSETQQYQFLRVLGFVPQPNLRFSY